jgi:trans-aconitate methyltransferase
VTGTLATTFFDDFYAGNPDPWSFATSEYERGKYTATLAALPRARYASAFEVGCSIGVLTRQLAGRCDRLLSIDAAEAPLPQARSRNADAPWVEIRRARVPEDWPRGRSFDLILLSEVLYYFSREDLARLAELTLETLWPGGDLVLVHWLPTTSYPLTGDEAVSTFVELAGDALRPTTSAREELYRLDVFRRA